ncbi:hypothetical protein AVDCRST_MAG92-5406 [uncultured Coleofasciculus sp.]|uniref:Uncharacterized protein n=1 Tax=uncultured Coleofasciculus sp. TaxID=1267456 RepID=A0A6J4KHL2_9CYAN|nr:hypothetical protein AVDCRST_MAG92-5406 [uncultured Coleofasciculus sp.]
MNQDDLLVQIHDMRALGGSASLSLMAGRRGADELPATEQQELALTTVEEISAGIEELVAANAVKPIFR